MYFFVLFNRSFPQNVSNDYGLYDIAKPLKAVEEDDFHKSYLIQEGVFATGNIITYYLEYICKALL